MTVALESEVMMAFPNPSVSTLMKASSVGMNETMLRPSPYPPDSSVFPGGVSTVD